MENFEYPPKMGWCTKHNSTTVCKDCEIDRLTAQLAEAKTANLAIRSERDQALAQLYSQLTEAKASAEAWQENCRLTERELEKERDKHADLIGKLAERDAEIERLSKLKLIKTHTGVINGDWCARMIKENTTLREEVERLREANRQLAGAAICPDHLKPENIRKQTAAEILNLLTQEEIRRITSVGDPRVTTISSKLLAMMTELRQRYGLEG